MKSIIGIILLILWWSLIFPGLIFIKYFFNSYLIVLIILFTIFEMNLLFLGLHFITYNIRHTSISYPYSGP